MAENSSGSSSAASDGPPASTDTASADGEIQQQLQLCLSTLQQIAGDLGRRLVTTSSLTSASGVHTTAFVSNSGSVQPTLPTFSGTSLLTKCKSCVI